ncbi:hypothetical protein Tco_1476626 [Tanacetum coccineum]
MQSKEEKVDSSTTLDAGLVVTESNEIESERYVSSNSFGKDTHAEVAEINSVNDKQPFAEVQLTVQHDTLANEKQHYVQSEPIYDTHLLEKVDRNTIPDSTNMCHRGGEIEHNVEKYQVSCPLLDPSFANMTTEFSNQSLESENIFLKKTITPRILGQNIRSLFAEKSDISENKGSRIMYDEKDKAVDYVQITSRAS